MMGRAGRQAWRRALPRRRPAPSSFRASSRWARSSRADFSVARDAYGAPQIVCSANARSRSAGSGCGHRRIADARPDQRIRRRAGAADADAAPGRPAALPPVAAAPASSSGNLRRVFGAAVPEAEIVRLAQAHYAHLWRLAGEFVRFRWLSANRKA